MQDNRHGKWHRADNTDQLRNDSSSSVEARRGLGWRRVLGEGLWRELRPGQTRLGRVSRLVSYGAFIDLGGVKGLAHISELSWDRIRHPSDVLQIGQQVNVYVLRVDRARQRVGLSLKRLHPDPWDNIQSRYLPGQIVSGEVVDVVPYGAFVRLEPGVVGLLHKSEIDGSHISDARDVLRAGQRLTLRITELDLVRHRMGLSQRQVPEGAQPEDAPPQRLSQEKGAEPMPASENSATDEGFWRSLLREAKERWG